MKKREIEIDILRVLAMLCVIWVHVGGMKTGSLPTSDTNCQWLIFLKSIVTWQVPVYVMISGRFFLDPERQMSFSKIFKAIKRLVIAFIVWNVVYQIYYILTDAYVGQNWKGILSQSLIGPYHFWYLYMIVGLYLITPFLRKITEEKRLSEYFIVLFFMFMLLTKYCVKLPFVGPTLDSMLNSMDMNFVLGYSGYYVLGYYLRRYPLSDKIELMLYICGSVLLLSGAASNTICSIRENAYTERFTGYTNPNTIIVAVAIYTLFTKRIGKVQFSEKIKHLISILSEHSFGVYLVHALILSAFAAIGLEPTILHPLLAMPLITVLAFMITVVIVMIVRKTPKLGKAIT